MQYLDSIIIHNFKSFKHANIKFSRGFNCIVGPNGSGKSNICDSLLFALGESSLKRMRVPNTSQLINSFAKPKKEDGVKRAYVKINFSGESPTEVARIIKSNNKISYKLDGKRVTRQELVDVLKAYKSEINDTNIIAQGEISYMINLNSKERRELIDVAAGIKEFNDKKETAMKELDKVETKINEARIVVNERKGFLDQLEKEKEDAEKYIELTDKIKRISFTLLKNIEKQSEADFNLTIEKIRTNESKKKEISNAISDLDLMLEKLSKEKEGLSKTLNEKSMELNGSNRVFENTDKEIAVKETEGKSLREKLSEYETQLTQFSNEKKKIKDQVLEGTKKLTEAQKQLDEKSKNLSSKEVYDFENGSQISKMGSNQKRIDELYLQEESLSKQYLQNKFETESLEKSVKILNQELEKLLDSKKTALANAKEKQELGKKVQLEKSNAEKELESLNALMQKKTKELDQVYYENINVKEQIAVLGGTSDKLNALLKKNISKGFYGRAYELCSYDSKYEFAVNACAINRLNYFVVDSAETADEAISLIKSAQLGRASFIPLEEIAFRYKEENAKLDKLIDHVEFDKKFENAFNYIFANTYVVESIEHAKKIGFGKGRFVTLDGELVEQSGIITGGSKKSLQSLASLESKLKNIESKQKSIREEISETESLLASKRKEIASFETENLNCSIELKHLEKELASIDGEINGRKPKLDESNEKIRQLEKSSAEIEKRRNSVVDELTALKNENEKIYAIESSSKGKAKIGKNEMEKLKELRAEVEKIKIDMATISKEQELRNARLVEIETEIKGKNEQNKDTMKKLAILDGELIELGKRKKELQERMGKSDASSQEILKKLQQHDSHISKFAADRGKSQGELEKINRELIEQESRKVQIQTRINDVKAELLSYQNVEALPDNVSDLDAKRTIAKSDLERLGAVNLRAPEMYSEKKKDVEEASAKLNVLGNEKDSIIAMINEIESKKLNIFNETLSDVNENFKKLYGYIFEGSASLQLENPKDPFNSGLSIMISSPKNRSSTVDSLSGGEKILVMLMLIFAIQTHDPMAFYIFDEIDISLDKENSKKLSRLMREISKKSQVIVISHNDSLITAADTAIGVVNRNHESKVVGIQLTPTEIKAN